jgi:hypothetical protein
MDQLDIFVHAPKQSASSRPTLRLEDLIPRRTISWEKRLERAADRIARLHVSVLYTRQVLECLASGPHGRVLLYADGLEQEIKPDPSQTGRIVYLTVDDARKIHAKLPLISTGGGTHGMGLRPAKPGEPVDPDPFLDLATIAT